jgi:enoyl-CoA hydratase
MPYETIEYRQDGPVGILTLNRPACLNAINFAMRDDLTRFFAERFTDRETRVIVITGAGRGFCAGLDMSDPAITAPAGGYTPEQAYAAQRTYSDFILAMRRCPQPLIGAINGAAAGAGFSIALACDIRLAAPRARFSAAYINIGVGGADMGSSWLLPRIVGLGNAARYLYTGDLFDAQEALRIGLVQALADPDRLMDEAMNLARNMAGKSPLGLKLTKEALDVNSGAVSLESAIRLEDRNQSLCISQLLSPRGGAA